MHGSNIKPYRTLKKYTDENRNTIYQNLWVAVKVILSKSFIALTVHFRKEERPQISNLSSYPKKTENEEQNKHITRRVEM